MSSHCPRVPPWFSTKLKLLVLAHPSYLTRVCSYIHQPLEKHPTSVFKPYLNPLSKSRAICICLVVW